MFIPVLLMGGIVGRIFNEFAFVVTVAIAASAFVSLTLTPMMSFRPLRALLKAVRRDSAYRLRSSAALLRRPAATTARWS